MTPIDYTRQADILDPERMAEVHVDLIGVGGIGTPTGLLLLKMGVSDMRIFDPDDVDGVNLPNQLYRIGDVGKSKVLACRDIWRRFTDTRVEAMRSHAELHRLYGTVVVGVDSMAARAALWRTCRRDRAAINWLIDARMGAESGVIFTIQPSLAEDEEFYERSLHTDTETVALPCTGRTVLFNTLFIAALIGRQVKRVVMCQRLERRIDFNLDDLSLFVA